MSYVANITHASATRMRIRVPCMRHDQAFFELLRHEFKMLLGVSAVEINPVTASALLLIDGDIATVRHGVENCQFLKFQKSAQHQYDSLIKSTSRLLAEADRVMKELSAGFMDFQSLLFSVLLILGIWQISRGEILASGSALLMSAFAFVR